MEQTATDTSRHCPACNAMMRPKAVFCHRCGRPVAYLAQVEETAESDAPQTQNLDALSETIDHHQETAEVPAAEPLPTITRTKEIDGSTIEEIESHEPETIIGKTDFRQTLEDVPAETVEEKPAEIKASPATVIAAEPQNIEPVIAQAPTEQAVEKVPKQKTPKRRAIKTEYVWEEQTADPTLRFALFTVGAVAFVVLIFWLARFIR